MNRDVLVLNKSWMPVHVISWKRSMNLIVRDEVLILDSEFAPYNFEEWTKVSPTLKGYPTVASVSMTIAVPEIIVLRHYNKLPDRDVKYTRENLFQRDKYTCQYCTKAFRRKYLTVDHVIPSSRNGSNNWDNLVTACFDCNSKKADRTPGEAGMHLLNIPKKPGWFNPVGRHLHGPATRDSWKTFLKGVGVEDEDETPESSDFI
jgi:5-methylcytosine-specific restriction endonuclease McrA